MFSIVICLQLAAQPPEPPARVVFVRTQTQPVYSSWVYNNTRAVDKMGRSPESVTVPQFMNLVGPGLTVYKAHGGRGHSRR